ncbi:MAG: aminoglycoside adenylyltransferase domain-containing protein [Caulobacterales bacterium]
MPTPQDPRAPLREPTPYPALNGLLSVFTERVRAVLGQNFVGAYLVGSLALGDFDENSDCDFVVVTRRDITEVERPALQAMHDTLHDLAPPWGLRLEGSYFPAGILRRWSLEPSDPPDTPPRPAGWADPGTGGSPRHVYPLLFLGNGERVLVRSEHDNLRLVRWIAREKGVVLAGPHPKTLIDPVTPDALRGEVREAMRTYAERHGTAEKIDAAWLQAFWVVVYCRMLHSLETGRVTSKKAATAWTMSHVEARWRPLIERAFATRFSSPQVVLGPPDPGEVTETVAFVQHVLGLEAQKTAQAQRAAAITARHMERAMNRPNPRDRGLGLSGRGPSRGGWTPTPTRPGGRGRRG